MSRGKRKSRTVLERLTKFDERPSPEEELNWNAYKPTERTPEQKLVVAILNRAIWDAIGEGKELTKREISDAYGWLTLNSEEPFSARWLITSLGIDADFGQDAILKEIHARRIELEVVNRTAEALKIIQRETRALVENDGSAPCVPCQLLQQERGLPQDIPGDPRSVLRVRAGSTAALRMQC